MPEIDQKFFYIQVGQRIRAERERRGLTQGALASLVSLTRTSVTNIEKGRQKILLHTFVDFVNALQVAPYELLPEIDIPSEKELKELLKGQPRKAQEWVKSTLKSIQEES